MYLNIDLIHSKKFNLHEVIVMQVIKQNKSEDLEDTLATYLTDKMIERFEAEGIVKYVKPKRKTDSQFKCMRLTSKGSKLLEDFQVPGLTEGDEQMFEYLCQMYLNNEDEERVIGNKKKTKMYCAIFRSRTNLTLHQMYWLCMQFLSVHIYTKKLENIFFDSNKHRYGSFEAHFEDSPLYQYLDENRELMERIWESKNC